MPTLKIEDRRFTSNPSQQPSSSRRKRSSQASFELSSSKECLVAEKGRENGRKEEKRENWSPNFLYGKKNVLLKVYTNGLYSHQDK